MNSIRTKLVLAATALGLLATACSSADEDVSESVPSPVDSRPAAAAEASHVPATVPNTPTSPPTSATPSADKAALRQGLDTPDGPPPRVDTSIAGVPLDQVVFDTFRGGFILLSEASDQVIEALRDVIKPVYQPKYDNVDGGDWLDEDELVIGYEGDTEAFAYPIRMLNLHEIVNELIDGAPVVITYCPLCGSGVVYSRELGDETLVFGNTSALYESDMVMYDHQTGSYWFQTFGEAIVGPLTGKRLTLLPSRTTTWADWKAQHPETKVLSRDLGLLRGGASAYGRGSFAGYQERLNQGRFAFPVDVDRLDSRLKPGESVLAVEVSGRHKAYALSADRETRLINDSLGGRDIVVVVRPEGPTGLAFFADVGGESHAFKLIDGAVVDEETGSLWNDAGRALGGSLAGLQLTPVPSRTSFWFSIAGAVPGIDLWVPPSP